MENKTAVQVLQDSVTDLEDQLEVLYQQIAQLEVDLQDLTKDLRAKKERSNGLCNQIDALKDGIRLIELAEYERMLGRRF